MWHQSHLEDFPHTSSLHQHRQLMKLRKFAFGIQDAIYLHQRRSHFQMCHQKHGGYQ
jgi:hypothetical protein